MKGEARAGSAVTTKTGSENAGAGAVTGAATTAATGAVVSARTGAGSHSVVTAGSGDRDRVSDQSVVEVTGTWGA